MKCECETRTKLLQTALELMWEQSYGTVSVDDICTCADVRKGSFYHFFPSKADLTIAAFERHWEDIQTLLDQAFSPLTPPLDRFRVYARKLYELQSAKKIKCGKACGCPYISVGLELSTQDEKIRQEVMKICRNYRRYFESALRDAEHEGLIPPGDHSDKAFRIHAYVVGLLVLVKIHNDPEILQNLEEGLFHLIQATTQPVIEAIS